MVVMWLNTNKMEDDPLIRKKVSIQSLDLNTESVRHNDNDVIAKHEEKKVTFWF